MGIFPDFRTTVPVLGCGCLQPWGTLYSVLFSRRHLKRKAWRHLTREANDLCLLAFPISASWLLFPHSVPLPVVPVFSPCLLSSPLLPLPTLVRECGESQAILVWPVNDLSSFGLSQPKKFLLFQFLSENLGALWTLQKKKTSLLVPANKWRTKIIKSYLTYWVLVWSAFFQGLESIESFYLYTVTQ